MQKVEPLDILYHLLVSEILTSEILGYLDTFLPCILVAPPPFSYASPLIVQTTNPMPFVLQQLYPLWYPVELQSDAFTFFSRHRGLTSILNSHQQHHYFTLIIITIIHSSCNTSHRVVGSFSFGITLSSLSDILLPTVVIPAMLSMFTFDWMAGLLPNILSNISKHLNLDIKYCLPSCPVCHSLSFIFWYSWWSFLVFSLYCGNVLSNPSLCISNAIFSKTNLFCLQPSNYSCMSSEDHKSINFNVSFPVHVAI